jgi:transcriptional regulator with GAF, ATPase, and Fis domain
METTTMLGASAAMRAIEREIAVAAACGAKVLITGESGVGKELVAQLIHTRGQRSTAPFVPMNCAGLPDALLESELFGHVRGSFTGAYRDKRGRLEAAHKGTIFMDEIGEMSLRMQAMLLRFLENGEIQRVGADRSLPPLDVRVIAATHRDLAARVADQSFREDLFYRLKVVHIEVPPLRDRRDDIPLLLRHFLQTFSSLHQLPIPEITEEALRHLLTYDWPGNVRELKNVAERMVVGGGRDGRVDVGSLPLEIGHHRRSTAMASSSEPLGEQRLNRLLSEGLSFWAEVHEPFMKRDLTREDVRQIVQAGLAYTRGNYKMLVRAFNMPPNDYKRFLSFLRTHGCHVSYQSFRMVKAGGPAHASAACA